MRTFRRSVSIAGARRRGALALALVMVTALIAAGCGGDPPDPNDIGLGPSATSSDNPNNYVDSMQKVMAATEDPSAPPLAQSVDAGNKNQLLAAATHWDAAVALATDVKPPKDAKAAHQHLIAAMRELSVWNHKVANAAPNKARTRKLGAQARSSKAARDFSNALNELKAAGYDLTPGDGASDPEATPLDGEPSP